MLPLLVGGRSRRLLLKLLHLADDALGFRDTRQGVRKVVFGAFGGLFRTCDKGAEPGNLVGILHATSTPKVRAGFMVGTTFRRRWAARATARGRNGRGGCGFSLLLQR